MVEVVAPVFQRKVPPAMEGVAVSVVEFPSQIVGLLTVTVATGFTETVAVVLAALQPKPET